jgi:large subunit ribosomal protein L15
MLQLNNTVALVKKRKRVGRGGSRGGTSGRGHKGQNARSGGGVGPLFEGGQMPLHRRLPKRGFTNARFKKVYEIISLGHLDQAFVDGDVVSQIDLVNKNLIKGKKGSLVKILGTGEITKNLTITANAFSKSAVTAIEKAGGKAQLIKES